MKLSKSLLVIPALSLLGAAAIGAGACSASVTGPDWTASVEPGSGAVVETDSCAALADCCTADDAGDLYCADVTTDCDTNFQYELNYGYCSGYTYTGFTVVDVSEPSGTPGDGSDGGTGGDDGGTGGDDAGSGDDGGTGGDDGGTGGDDAGGGSDGGSGGDDAGGSGGDDAGGGSGGDDAGGGGGTGDGG
jgi:hypothetical protein